MELGLIQKIAVFALPVLFAITLHEAAHGYAARRFGDMTAALAGRISLNPLRHIDPIGTVLVPLATLLITKLFLGQAFLFGWAKPVPVNFRNLRHPKRDMLWVAVAGPLANLAMALAWALVIQFAAMFEHSGFALPLILMGAAGVFINIIVMALNLLPLPPLDGGRILASLLPPRAAMGYARIEPYGLVILIALMFSGLLGKIVWPLIVGGIVLVADISGIGATRMLTLIEIVLG
jgi:Zn-dependent protease